MILFCDSEGNIYDVDKNSTGNNTLIQIEVIDDEENPFKDWSSAKICCYRCHVTDKHIDMITPRVDSRLIEHIDQLGKENNINASDAADLRAAIEELYEMLEEV